LQNPFIFLDDCGRFDIEGDEETQVNITSRDQIPSMLIPSLPHEDQPTRGD